MSRRALSATLRDPLRRHLIRATQVWLVGLVLASGATLLANRPAEAPLALQTMPVATAVQPTTTSTTVLATTTTTAAPAPTTIPPAPPTTAAAPPVAPRSAAPAPPTTAAPAPPVTEPPAPPPPAPPAAMPANVDASAEEQLLADHNARRAEAGLPPLQRDPCLDAVARSWSAQMLSGGSLVHNPSYGSDIGNCVSWSSVAENVGYASSGSQLAGLFWNSPAHQENILGNYSLVGIGVVVGDNGLRWATIEFAG